MPRAAINGLDMYYEVHGVGWPLLLLHGGSGSIPEKWIPGPMELSGGGGTLTPSYYACARVRARKCGVLARGEHRRAGPNARAAREGEGTFAAQ
jgi:hypothetical protein